MSDLARHSDAVHRVAAAIEHDLDCRGLMPGDRYFTSEEARQMFRVGKGVMNQALSLLANRDVLVRRQKAGTFVGPNGGSSRSTTPQTIFVLLPADREGLVDVPFDIAVETFRRHVPSSNVQFSFFPSQNAAAYVRDLVESARGLKGPWGILAIGCPYEVMDFLSSSGAAVVALTSFMDDQWAIPSLDTDRQMAGRVLARRLLNAGHQQVALMNFSGGSQGQHDFYDGISEAMTEAALPHNALIYRELPPDAALVKRHVRELLRRVAPPTAFIARSLRIAQVIADALEQSGEPRAAEVVIVFFDHDTQKVAASRWVHAVPALPFERILDRAAAMLKDAMAGKKPVELKSVLPVELREQVGFHEGHEGHEEKKMNHERPS